MKAGKIQKNTSLSTRALLVSVNISQWVGRKIDRRATETANTIHNANSLAGNYNKKLLPAAKELEAVNTLVGQARKYYYEQTLPWMSDGTRIISSQNYLNFQNEMRKIKSAFESAVKEFEEAYPKLKADAVNLLGGLYNIDEYPENIGERFSFEVNFFPMPDSKDFRVAVSDKEKKDFENKMKAIESAAMRDACNRLYSVIHAATVKLSDPKSIFRDTLLENINEVAKLLPALNISNDPQLDQLTEDAKKLIDSVDIKVVRVNSSERDKAKKALSDIESRMGAFMGGLK